MGGKINLFIGILTTLIFYWIESKIVWFSFGMTILIFWTFGIMHNYAMNSARNKRELILQNKLLEGYSAEELKRVKDLPVKINKGDLNNVPDLISMLNMIFSLIIYVLLLVAIYKTIF